MPTHADVIARELAELGVEYVFGLPGGEILAFVDACRRAGLRFLLTGHEASAAWAAQVVGQITGIPGVCASTLGPGATNLVTGVANAWLDRAPLLAITAQMPGGALRTMTHQRLPLEALFSPITKASVSVGEEDTAALLKWSARLAAAPRPGPVHIALPSDVAVQESRAGDGGQRASEMPAASAGAIHDIAARLAAAIRPLLLIGLGAPVETAPAIRALVDKLQAPFVLTPKAKGIVSEDHPLFLGVASGMAIDRDVLETVRAADLILGIGFDPVECDKTWFADADVVSLDSAPMAEGRYKPIEAVGDLNSLLAKFDPVAPKSWPADLLQARRTAMRRKPRDSPHGISPLRLIQELRSVFPREGVVTCDVGSHKLLLGQFWPCYEPGTFFMSNGLSGMGFGIPAAIAAQLVHPGKPVMAVVGDGGMLMMIHDLALMREQRLPILIVVLSDRSLSLIRVAGGRRGFPPYGVDFSPPDFAAVAEAFGIAGKRVATVEDAKQCVEQALHGRAPLVLDVPIDFSEYYELV